MEEDVELDGKEWEDIEKWAMTYVAPKSMLTKKLPKSIMAKKALGTLDGDGTRVNININYGKDTL